jgi:hypothetical protein
MRSHLRSGIEFRIPPTEGLDHETRTKEIEIHRVFRFRAHGWFDRIATADLPTAARAAHEVNLRYPER